MGKLKKIIIFLILTILILSIIILQLIQENLDEIDSITEDGINYEDFQSQFTTSDVIEKVSNKNIYYASKSIIEKYISYIGNQEIGKQALDKIFATSYKSEFNVTQDNVFNNVSKFAKSEIYIEDMYRLEKSESISLIIVKGKTKSDNIEFNIIIKMDSLNQTYEIYPEEFINKHGYNDLTKLSELNAINSDNLTPNEYNTFDYKNISNLEMCNYYLEDYIYNITTDVEKAYNLLDEEYKTVRFGSLESYKSYVNENVEKIKNITLKEYTTLKYPDYKQYVCIDTEGNYYLFRETAIMEYTLLLDTYTVVLPEFEEKYKSATTMEKVALNINNFIQSINDKNYNYAYKVLNETFKANNFSTQSDFERYIKNNLFEKNNVEYVDYTMQNGTHVYSLEIVDFNSENLTKVGLTVIMQLGSGTNFTMSFSIN